MSDQNSNHAGSGQLIQINIDSLSFDSFDRNPQTDIVCVSPVRTVVRREEEIVLIRRVRKVEEVDASPACPVNTTQTVQTGEGEATYTAQTQETGV
ncbi:hypothetical protein IQ235_05830 [Oscillatoriales cyanobacterium LEGE 11467]|uniref:Uncharacterized protein n=1 Tax=Zarconia navalis LEGE 11467 TaxID=1828826 RepID=A0A928VUC5_9CYAN|nr:hypothetical protein [Zarconia navalis]MBE9040311.1 hypothetical protein [Zarconia navalis LEGE 11467]